MDPEVVKGTIGVALRRRAGYCDFWAIFQWGRSAGAKTDRATNIYFDNANDDEEGQEA
jgi:hypothetical protein